MLKQVESHLPTKYRASRCDSLSEGRLTLLLSILSNSHQSDSAWNTHKLGSHQKHFYVPLWMTNVYAMNYGTQNKLLLRDCESEYLRGRWNREPSGLWISNILWRRPCPYLFSIPGDQEWIQRELTFVRVLYTTVHPDMTSHRVIGWLLIRHLT